MKQPSSLPKTKDLLTSLIDSREDLKFWLFILRCALLTDSPLAKTEFPKRIATHICVTSDKQYYQKEFISFFTKTIENSVNQFSETEFTKILEKFLEGLSAKKNISITRSLETLLYLLVQLEKNEFQVKNFKHQVNNLFKTHESAKTQLIEYEIIEPANNIKRFLIKNSRWSDIWEVSVEADKQAAQKSRKPRVYAKSILLMLSMVMAWIIISLVFFRIGMQLYPKGLANGFFQWVFIGSGIGTVMWSVTTLKDEFGILQKRYKIEHHEAYVEEMEKTIDDILNDLVNLKIEKLLETSIENKSDSESKADSKKESQNEANKENKYYLNMQLNQGYTTTSQILLNLEGALLPKNKTEKTLPTKTSRHINVDLPESVNVIFSEGKINLIIYPKLEKIVNNDEKKTPNPIKFVSSPGADQILSFFPYHTLEAIFQAERRENEFNKFAEFAKFPFVSNVGYRKLTDGIERKITVVINGKASLESLEWELIRGGKKRLLAFAWSANGYTLLIPICLHDLHTKADKKQEELGKVTIDQKDLETLFCKVSQKQPKKSKKEEASDEESSDKTSHAHGT